MRVVLSMLVVTNIPSFQTSFYSRHPINLVSPEIQGPETMIRNLTSKTTKKLALGLVALFCVSSATGCQTSINGQTLPSPYYLQDDVQYFPSGPEFKLPREAAALRAATAQEKENRR